MLLIIILVIYIHNEIPGNTKERERKKESERGWAQRKKNEKIET